MVIAVYNIFLNLNDVRKICVLWIKILKHVLWIKIFIQGVSKKLFKFEIALNDLLGVLLLSKFA